MVERQWRTACKTENEISYEDPLKYSVLPVLPTDPELAAAFSGRRRRSCFYILSQSINFNSLLLYPLYFLLI